MMTDYSKYYLKTRHGIVLGIVKVNEEKNVLHWGEVVDLLNSLEKENEWLKEQRDYWSAKYEEGTETFISHFTEENQKSFRELLELKDSECLRLTKENKKLRKQVDDLQNALAEICATFIIEGFEIEIGGENLRELLDDE